MQSGLGKADKWIFKFEIENAGVNPLMGWETSSNMLSELNLEFSTKELAIEYAKKNKISFEIIEPQKRKTVKKSYAENFLK
jgi:NADH dehydrogenase (ubiquinone) Fe-S protein 4